MMDITRDNQTLDLTGHASLRLAQLNLGAEDVAYVLRHGTRVHRTGVTFWYLRRRDIPVPHQRTTLARLEGMVVMKSHDGAVINVYRSADGIGSFNADPAEVERIMVDDPAIVVGILTFEVHPVRGSPGDAPRAKPGA